MCHTMKRNVHLGQRLIHRLPHSQQSLLVVNQQGRDLHLFLHHRVRLELRQVRLQLYQARLQ